MSLNQLCFWSFLFKVSSAPFGLGLRLRLLRVSAVARAPSRWPWRSWSLSVQVARAGNPCSGRPGQRAAFSWR